MLKPAEYALIYRKAKKDLIQFRKLFLTAPNEKDRIYEVAPAKFHYQWSHLLLNTDYNILIESFRESAKSQYILRSFPLYALTYPCEKWDYIVILKNNQDLASDKLEEIETEAQINPLIRLKIHKINKCNRKQFNLDVYDLDGNVHNVTIEAFGKGSSIRGLSKRDKRPKIVIGDDLQDLEDTQGETVPEKDFNWFLSDVSFLGQFTRIFLIGNNLGEKCILERIMSVKGQLEKIKFLCIRNSAIDNEGLASWPEWLPLSKLLLEKADYRLLGKLDTWYRERMCLALSEETRVFKREYMQYYSTHQLEKLIGNMNIFISGDPSFGKDPRTNDPRAWVCVGVTADNYWYVLDVFNQVVTPYEFIDALFGLVLKYKPIAVRIEQLESLRSFIESEMRKRNIFFNLDENKHKGINKEIRIKEKLQPRFKTKTVLFPEGAVWLTAMEDQLYSFPEGAHDDMIDALAYISDFAFQPLDPSNKKRPVQTVAITTKKIL